MSARNDSPGKRRLGRGLSSLMPQTVSVKPEAAPPDDARALQYLKLTEIRPGAHQPRQSIDEDRLDELVASIRTSGVMQPIVVRKNDEGFELVAGERRWRAATRAGLETIPAIVRNDLSEQDVAELALIENLQREDLNPIEQAEAFANLMSKFNLTQSQVAERVGKDRSSVANILRLNSLDRLTRDDVRDGRLSLGHAKVLLSVREVETRRPLAEAAIRGGWSVRELERRVKMLDAPRTGEIPSAADAAISRKPIHVENLERELSACLGLTTEIKLGRSRNAGQVVIWFNSLDEFERLVEQIRRSGSSS